MSSRDWLDSITSEMPVQPPFRLSTYDVRVGDNISSGPDHGIVGVTIWMDVDGQHRDAVPAMTPAQARGLAAALSEGANLAEERIWFRDTAMPPSVATTAWESEDWPTHCKCGAPVQSSDGLDHRCRQCAQHCAIAAYRAGGGSL